MYFAHSMILVHVSQLSPLSDGTIRYHQIWTHGVDGTMMAVVAKKCQLVLPPPSPARGSVAHA